MAPVIRVATPADTVAISAVIIAALQQSNAQDYSPQIIAQVKRSFSPEAIVHLMTQRQVFVATIGDQVAATASLEQNTLRSVFVDPVFQGKGMGRLLVSAVESAAAQHGVRQLRVPSSITAEGFYHTLGYRKIRDEFHGEERTIVMQKWLPA